MIEDCACGHGHMGDVRLICNVRACGCQEYRPKSEVETPRVRAFVLERDVDETGVSGTGVVAEGVVFSDGVVALRWTSTWPTSVVFHDRGLASVEAVHGHHGTRIVFQ